MKLEVMKVKGNVQYSILSQKLYSCYHDMVFQSEKIIRRHYYHRSGGGNILLNALCLPSLPPLLPTPNNAFTGFFLK